MDFEGTIHVILLSKSPTLKNMGGLGGMENYKYKYILDKKNIQPYLVSKNKRKKNRPAVYTNYKTKNHFHST